MRSGTWECVPRDRRERGVPNHLIYEIIFFFSGFQSLVGHVTPPRDRHWKDQVLEVWDQRLDEALMALLEPLTCEHIRHAVRVRVRRGQYVSGERDECADFCSQVLSLRSMAGSGDARVSLHQLYFPFFRFWAEGCFDWRKSGPKSLGAGDLVESVRLWGEK